VLPNALDPAPFARPKLPEAARTLGLVGWGAPAKDAGWALDVLAELRRTDPSWRLRLVGLEPEAPGYAAEVRARMAQEDVAGAVDVVGASDDVPGELTRIGALVSSSTRESFHLAVAEAAASGARVAVRDWPTLSRYGGPHGVWPDDWVVRTPQEAAALLLSSAPQTPAPDLSPGTVAAGYAALLERVVATGA
jgi:glycosyltransferase involved in cell wall biosynthesis